MKKPVPADRPLLSISMIFRDDIRCIERCLKSLEPLKRQIPCEVVMADTGSVDGSRAVADRYADLVIDFPWINDFSAARNASLARCRGLWAMVMDTDEWLEGDLSTLTMFLRTKEADRPCILLPTERSYTTWALDEHFVDMPQERIFCMTGTFHYIGAIHESPTYGESVPESDVECVMMPSFILHHDGYVGVGGEGGREKRRRNLLLLRQSLEKHPDNLRSLGLFLDSAPLEPDFREKLQRAVALLREGAEDPGGHGPRLLARAIQFAADGDMPETLEWCRLAEELYPNSIYTRIDVAYYQMTICLNGQLYDRIPPLAERYFQGLEELQRDKLMQLENIRGPLLSNNPSHMALAHVVLARALAGLGRWEEAEAALRETDCSAMDRIMIRLSIESLRELHTRSGRDTAPPVRWLWEGISRAEPGETEAAERRRLFQAMGASLFSEDPDFPPPRPAYSLFLPLAGDCALGDAAAVFEETNPAVLTALLARQRSWDSFPGRALTEAVKRGGVFPPAGAGLGFETLAGAAASIGTSDAELLEDLALAEAAPEDWTGLMWRSALTVAAIQRFNWKGRSTNSSFRDPAYLRRRGEALARAFALAEERLLSRLYSPRALETLEPLPLIHQAGILCAGAFQALDRGDTLEYVRLLRRALERNPHIRDMTEFLAGLAPTETLEEALARRAAVMSGDSEPEELLEAAEFTLRSGGGLSLACATLTQLYQAGYFRERILPLLTETLLQPALGELQERYRRNAAALAEYPWLFRKDFPAFSSLPLVFFPFEGGYFPFRPADRTLLDYTSPGFPAVDRNYFRDPEQPVLAEDVFSQYVLEYMNDNVRPSEYVGKDNHIYLAYSSWEEFCAWLQVLDLTGLLPDKKLVFLMEEERGRYPIDFKRQFGIDYAAFPPRPVGPGEVKRLIWHARLLDQGAGDSFARCFEGNPGVVYLPAEALPEAEAAVEAVRRDFSGNGLPAGKLQERYADWDEDLFQDLARRPCPDLGTCFRAWALARGRRPAPESRFAPAVFFQPLPEDAVFGFSQGKNGGLRLESPQMGALWSSPLFQSFRYVKAFLPLRRFTACCAGAVRQRWAALQAGKASGVLGDALTELLLNRCYLASPLDPLLHDAAAVRLEDLAARPAETAAALTAFLDLPEAGEPPEPVPEEDTAEAEYLGENGCILLECLLGDAFSQYGYELRAWDGQEPGAEALLELADSAGALDGYIRRSAEAYYRVHAPRMPERAQGKLAEEYMEKIRANRRVCVRSLYHCAGFEDGEGYPLRPLPLLAPAAEAPAAREVTE